MDIDFSVIIPHKNSISTLHKLINSIPKTEKIEIIVADNSEVPIKKEEVCTDRNYNLLWTPPERFAGGARNEGLRNARGKWLVFADADDYFENDAFDVFYSFFNTDADLVYFCANSIYSDTGERAYRSEVYTQSVKNYLNGKYDEWSLRSGFHVPWAKMIRRQMVVERKILFDEVPASNDAFFSLVCAYNAKKIEAVDIPVYVVTVTKGSLTRRRDKSVVESRFNVALKCNQYIRRHNHPECQQSIMLYFRQSFSFGISTPIIFFLRIIKYRQNPFVGWRNWFKTALKNKRQEAKERKYIVK